MGELYKKVKCAEFSPKEVNRAVKFTKTPFPHEKLSTVFFLSKLDLSLLNLIKSAIHLGLIKALGRVE